MDTPLTGLMLVEDESTAANIRPFVDPERMTVCAIDARFVRRPYDVILVRYPSPNWFEHKAWTGEQFATFIRQNVTTCLRPGSTFQYI